VGEDDKTLLVFDIEKGVIIGNLKTSNATITCMTIDHFLQRLYCATREGMLLFFDITDVTPQLVHSMRMILPESQGSNYIK
jgi:hypothetical protein